MRRLVAHPKVEQEGDGVAEYLAKQPARQVPEVTCPHPLYGVTSRELTENGVDAVTKTAQERAFARSRILFLQEYEARSSTLIRTRSCAAFGEC